MKKFSTLMVIVAGILWGSMGLFVRWFYSLGFSSMQTATVRITTSAVSLLLIAVCLFGTDTLKIKFRDIVWFLLSGIISIFGMSWMYFESINKSSMCMSAILLYTAPFIVAVFSCVFFKEKFTVNKFVALIIAFFGCVFVTGTDGAVTKSGIMFGVGSGLAYASYSLFGKILLKRYSPMTVTVYSFAVASVAFLYTGDVKGIFNQINSSQTPTLIIVVGIVMGIVTATLPFLLYTYGLKGMEAGKVAVIAYTEPLVAAVLGYLVFGEFSGCISIIGIVLIISAVLIINRQER